MGIKYKIHQLDRKTSDGFVVVAHYSVEAVDGEYSVSAFGSCEFNQSQGSFIPYESLTEEIVIGWVKRDIDVEAIETKLASKIEKKKNPIVVSGIPWQQPNP